MSSPPTSRCHWLCLALLGPALLGMDAEAAVVKRVLRVTGGETNLLSPAQWRPWQAGFDREGEVFVCDNGAETKVQRGASQTVTLNQKRPMPLVASVFSKSVGVGGGVNSDYSLYLDLVFMDGTPLWGQVAPFSVGTHDWEQREVRILPDKPVRSVSMHLLLRRHPGKAWFRKPELHQLDAPQGALMFDGVPIERPASVPEGFALREVAAAGDFVDFADSAALAVKLTTRRDQRNGATFFEGTLGSTSAQDRAVTLYYSLPVDLTGWQWCQDPGSSQDCQPDREYANTSRFPVGANGRLSKYPLAAVVNPQSGRGRALALDMSRPAFFRVGANTGTGELFLAYDFGLTAERPTASFRFCLFDFKAPAGTGFRVALQRLYELFPDQFRCRVTRQGLWMPFAKISEVDGWEDFGFAFKEGNNETAWDDAHGITTFHYTEPLTWWMKMAPELPRTMAAARAEAQRLAAAGDRRARSLLTSGYHDANGNWPARLRDTPWCNGAVWSLNSSPGVPGEVTDFKLKWNPELCEQLYGPGAQGVLDGEYVDSSEGYVTDVLNFRRDHFAGAETPLTFALDTRQPAIFRGLIAFEYVRALEQDMHARAKLMMANSTPIRLCWLAPLLDVMGQETNWHPGGKWTPLTVSELLYRRALAGPKPYCFLMNTDFSRFSNSLVEKYMQRCLAFGMFPGFFSADASTSQYFRQPRLYNRDRALFRKYLPLCRRVAEAGWQPVTRASTTAEGLVLERFGDAYLTLFNPSTKTCSVPVTCELIQTGRTRELVSGKVVAWQDGQTTVTLPGEGVAVLALRAATPDE